jgi:hypothetical protein
MSPHGEPEHRDDDVARLLHDWTGGDPQALERLIDLVYPELHRIAAQHLRRERQGHTLQPTALRELEKLDPQHSRIDRDAAGGPRNGKSAVALLDERPVRLRRLGG